MDLIATINALQAAHKVASMPGVCCSPAFETEARKLGFSLRIAACFMNSFEAFEARYERDGVRLHLLEEGASVSVEPELAKELSEEGIPADMLIQDVCDGIFLGL